MATELGPYLEDNSIKMLLLEGRVCYLVFLASKMLIQQINLKIKTTKVW